MRWLTIVALVSLAAGCGGAPSLTGDADDGGEDRPDRAVADEASDATVEADGEEAALPGAGSITSILADVEITTDRLCDLDGDGIEDNALADIGEPYAQMLAMAVNSEIDNGRRETRPLGLHVPWVDDLLGPNDSEAVLIPIVAIDADDPPDDADDYSGEEPFYCGATALDACGEPLHPFPGTEIVEGHVSTPAGTLAIPVSGGNLFVFHGARLEGVIESDGGTEMTFCGSMLIHDLGDMNLVDDVAGATLLEGILAGGTMLGMPAVRGVSPDVDVDGDGRERFEISDEGLIESCIDGDHTVIEGRECWRDEAMADGFSFAGLLEGVGARFAGREPGWEDGVEGTCEGGPPEESFFDPR